MGWETWSQKRETAWAHDSGLDLSLTHQCLIFQTLVLVGCFSVFWTIYYMLEVCLSQRNKASTHGCRKGCCPWPPRRQNSKDVGTALESMPLCSSKDLDGADSEHGNYTTTSSFLAPELDCPPHQPPDLLQRESGQIC